MADSLMSRGALAAVFGNDQSEQVAEPIVQCVQIKQMDKKDDSAPDRWRLVLSDAQNFIQCMLATQANDIIISGKLKKNSICRLKAFNPQIVKGKKIIIVVEMEVLQEHGEPEKIGAPVALDPAGANDGNQAQPNGVAANGFYGNKPAQPPQQQQSRTMATRPASTSSHANLYPIEALSPYAHKWTIKARCTHKSDIKTWHKQSGEGKLFSVNLLDDTGEIRATGFNAECDALYDVFQDGGIYYISSPCRVQLAKKQFTNLNNDYELTFERDTHVERAEDQDSNVPQVRYNFTSIGTLQSIEKDSTIDCVGILKDVGEVSQITSKTTSKPYDKRELTLVDDTMHSVRLTIWGASATQFDAPVESVVAFKGLKVSDFGGRSLSLLSSGSMSVDPDIDEAHKLRGWYDAQAGQNTNFTAQAQGTMTSGGRQDQYKSIGQIRDENLGMSDQADYFTLKATILYVKQDNVAYPACSTPDCNKKVVETDPGAWRCEKCDKTWPKPLWRYIMTVNVEDHTGQLWMNIFDDVGRVIMGMPANDIMEMKENDEQAASKAFDEANCKQYIFRCRAKMDNFQDQQRVRYHAMNAAPPNFSAECAKLTEILKQYSLDSDSLFVN